MGWVYFKCFWISYTDESRSNGHRWKGFRIPRTQSARVNIWSERLKLPGEANRDRYLSKRLRGGAHVLFTSVLASVCLVVVHYISLVIVIFCIC